MTGNNYALTNREKFRFVFFNIKKKTDELLSEYNNIDFMKNPSVDIHAIARENGIIDIERVAKKDIPEKHGTLKNGIIKLNKDDPSVEQNFTIGHELEHYIRQKAHEQKNVRKRMKLIMTETPIKVNEQDEKQAKSVFEEAVAARSDYAKIVELLKKNAFFISKAATISKNASINFGKCIPADKALNSIAKLICTGSTKLELDDFIIKATDDLYNEEIADYFAANLLVPIERFMLWEDKSDIEIASAFKVPVNCIEKRRQEIELELKYLAE